VTAPRRTFSSRKPKDFMTQCIAVSFVRGSLRMEKSTTEWRAFQREPAAASTAVESAPLAFPHDGLTHPVSPTQPSGLPAPVSSVHPNPLAPARLHQGVDALTDDSPLLSLSPSPFSLRARALIPPLLIFFLPFVMILYLCRLPLVPSSPAPFPPPSPSLL
jgi:hypothetical protein